MYLWNQLTLRRGGRRMSGFSDVVDLPMMTDEIFPTFGN